jgi:hypothetical protein
MTSLVSLIKTNLLRLIIILFSDTLGGAGVSLNWPESSLLFFIFTIFWHVSFDRFVRAWQSFNALGYDDKISDGFYDLYSIGNGPASVSMPSLVELRAQPFSHTVNWEAVLVHRGEDPELMKLEEKALIMALELRSRTSEFVGEPLVQKLASLVASHMGGLVFDPESMLARCQSMISSLRTKIGSVVVPLGQLKVGLARHRALLFKVSKQRRN